MDWANLHVETTSGCLGRLCVMLGVGSVSVCMPANPVQVFEYSSVMPDGFEVAIGHTYP